MRLRQTLINPAAPKGSEFDGVSPYRELGAFPSEQGRDVFLQLYCIRGKVTYPFRSLLCRHGVFVEEITEFFLLQFQFLNIIRTRHFRTELSHDRFITLLELRQQVGTYC